MGVVEYKLVFYAYITIVILGYGVGIYDLVVYG